MPIHNNTSNSISSSIRRVIEEAMRRQADAKTANDGSTSSTNNSSTTTETSSTTTTTNNNGTVTESSESTQTTTNGDPDSTFDPTPAAPGTSPAPNPPLPPTDATPAPGIPAPTSGIPGDDVPAEGAYQNWLDGDIKGNGPPPPPGSPISMDDVNTFVERFGEDGKVDLNRLHEIATYNGPLTKSIPQQPFTNREMALAKELDTGYARRMSFNDGDVDTLSAAEVQRYAERSGNPDHLTRSDAYSGYEAGELREADRYADALAERIQTDGTTGAQTQAALREGGHTGEGTKVFQLEAIEGEGWAHAVGVKDQINNLAFGIAPGATVEHSGVPDGPAFDPSLIAPEQLGDAYRDHWKDKVVRMTEARSDTVEAAIGAEADVVNMSLSFPHVKVATQMYGELSQKDQAGQWVNAGLRDAILGAGADSLTDTEVKQKIADYSKEIYDHPDVTASLERWQGSIDKAVDANLPIVIAAGNQEGFYQGWKEQGVNWPDHPSLMNEAAIDERLIVVGSATGNGTDGVFGDDDAAFYSNDTRNVAKVDVLAEGDLRPATSKPHNSYGNGFGGTSFAAPVVAASIALLKAENPDMTVAEISAALKAASVDTVAEENREGAGRLDIAQLVTGEPTDPNHPGAERVVEGWKDYWRAEFASVQRSNDPVVDEEPQAETGLAEPVIDDAVKPPAGRKQAA